MKLRWTEPIATAIGANVFRALAATWRFRETGAEHWRSLAQAGKPFIFVLWHSRILPLMALHKRQNIVVLVSRHRDGGYIADLAEQWGYRPVRGSTRRGGEAGLLGLVRALEAGAVVAVTPDGPRGPARRVQPGAIAAAQHAGVPIIPVGARPSSAWYVRSWDRLCIPKPLTRVEVWYAAPIVVGPGKDGLRRGIEAVGAALNVVTGSA